jgi:hypothetical protein
MKLMFFFREKDRAKLSWDRCLRHEDSPLVGMLLIKMNFYVI